MQHGYYIIDSVRNCLLTMYRGISYIKTRLCHPLQPFLLPIPAHTSPPTVPCSVGNMYDSTSEQEMCGLRDQSFLGPRDEQRCRLDPSLRPTMRPDA